MIPDEAVEAAAKALWEPYEHGDEWFDEFDAHKDYLRGYATKALEAAAPHMLSHEREETRLAHVDAVVNADAVDRLQGQLETASVKWNEAVAEAYVDGALSAAQADTLWLANPYR